MWGKFICVFLCISFTLSVQSTQNSIAHNMLKMVHKTFGQSKWKLAMADGVFTKSLMNIIKSLQQQPITGRYQQKHDQTNVRKVILWAKMYALADKEYLNAYNDLIENHQLSQQIMKSKNAREDEQKQQILQLFNHLISRNEDSLFNTNQLNTAKSFVNTVATYSQRTTPSNSPNREQNITNMTMNKNIPTIRPTNYPTKSPSISPTKVPTINHVPVCNTTLTLDHWNNSILTYQNQGIQLSAGDTIIATNETLPVGVAWITAYGTNVCTQNQVCKWKLQLPHEQDKNAPVIGVISSSSKIIYKPNRQFYKYDGQGISYALQNTSITTGNGKSGWDNYLSERFVDTDDVAEIVLDLTKNTLQFVVNHSKSANISVNASTNDSGYRLVISLYRGVHNLRLLQSTVEECQ